MEQVMRIIPRELAEKPKLLSVFELMVQGEPEKEIAKILRLSHHTVHGHVKTIYRQLNVSSRPLLLAELNQRLIKRIEQIEAAATSNGSPVNPSSRHGTKPVASIIL